MKFTSLTIGQLGLVCIAVLVCVTLMGSTCLAQVSFLVDFTAVDNGGGVAATAADFAVNDSAVDAAAPVNVLNSDTAIPGTQAFGVTFNVPAFAITGTDTGATPGTVFSSVSISDVNGSFNGSSGAPFGSINSPPVGDPILNDYIFANSNNNFTATIDTSAIVGGSIVTLLAYSHGDQSNQFANLSLDVGGTSVPGALLGGGPTSVLQPFETFVFTQPAGVTSLDLTIDNAGGSQFAALNGFSITSIEPVPEPSSLVLVGFASLGLAARRKR